MGGSVRVLITGVAGFIGSHLAERFADMGHEVWGFDNFETGSEANWPLAADIDLRDRRAVYDYANVVRPELVVHCAASYKDPDKWHVDTDTNVAGSINAALVAKHHQCGLVYFQTVLPPLSSYAISKIAGEQYLRLSGQPLAVFRLASIFGPRNLTGPIPTFYKRIRAGEPCMVVEGVTRDFIYIDDVVDYAVWHVLREQWGTYDVGSGIETPIAAIPPMIARVLRKDSVMHFIPKPENDVPHYDMTPDQPGFMRTRLQYAITQTIEWYEKAGPFDTYTHLRLETSNAT